MAILISFDIDGTLEVGDPPGVLTMEFVRKTQEAGILVGSCSDRPISSQRAIWEKHGISSPMSKPSLRPMFTTTSATAKTWTVNMLWRRGLNSFGRTKP